GAADGDQLPARRRGGAAADRRADAGARGAHGRRRRPRRGAREPAGAAALARGGLPRADRRGGRRMMAELAAAARVASSRPRRLFVHQLRAEQLVFWRSREAAFFIFLFPLLLFLLLGSV